MRESERPGKVIEYLMLAGNVFLGLVVLELIVHGLVDYADATFLFQTQKKPVLALLCLFMTAFLLLVFSVCRRLTENLTLRKTKMISALLLLPAFALQIYMLFYYRSSYLFDNAFVTGGASALAMDGQVAKEAVYYLSVYPNQNAYAVLTAVLWKLGTAAGISRAAMPLLLNCVNLVFLDTAAVLFLLTVCAYKKQTPGGFVRILFLLLCNPFLYIGVSYYYTITLSMPFVMGILYLYVRFLRKKEKHPYVVLVLLGLVVGFGYLLRATTMIPFIAVIACLLFFGRLQKRDLLAASVAVLTIVGVSAGNRQYIGLDTKDTAFPLTHWVMMSMTSPGSHNEADETYTASFPTAAEKKVADRERLMEKLQAMTAGDLLALAHAKVENTWGRGSNGYPVYLENCLRTDGLYPYLFGDHKDFVILYHQGYYLCLLLGIFYDLLRTVRKKQWDSYVFQMTFLGAVLFYLLWETGSQYSLPFLFVLQFLAGNGMEQWEETAVSDREKERKLQRITCVILLAGLLVFAIDSYSVFTGQTQEYTHPVVMQLLANEELSIGKEKLLQTFEASQPFDRVIFQWRNDDSSSDAVYEAVLASETGVIAEEEITGAGQPYNGATVLSFPTVTPDGTQMYTLSIRKKSGTDELRFVTYSMGYYDAYAGGTLTLGGQELTKDLLLAVSRTEIKTYTTAKRYWAFTAFFIAALAVLFVLAGRGERRRMK